MHIVPNWTSSNIDASHRHDSYSLATRQPRKWTASTGLRTVYVESIILLVLPGDKNQLSYREWLIPSKLSSHLAALQILMNLQVYILVLLPQRKTSYGQNFTQVCQGNIGTMSINLLICQVGNAVITKEEYRQLRVKTAALVDDPDHYIVTIEVFHQLHCLVSWWIGYRQFFY